MSVLALLTLIAGGLWQRAAGLGRLAAVAGRAIAPRLVAAGRRGSRWTTRHGAVLAQRLHRGLTHRLIPGAALAVGVGVALTATGLDRVSQTTEHAATLAGIHLDRALQAALDAATIAVMVGAPAAWRWLRPRAAHAAALATTAGRRAWGETRPRLPGLVRASALGAGSAASVLALGWMLLHPALVAAASLVDTGDLPPLDERSVVHAADGGVLATWHGEIDRRVVSLSAVPEHVRHAVISAEDASFRQHDGYDLGGIARALWANLRAGEVVQGGSTITQQLAKRTYTGAAVTVERKISELIYAVSLERDHSKDELLARYLNQVYFGSGAYGIAAAAEELFATTPGELTVSQGAVLAGLIRSPGALDPRQDRAEVRQRRDEVLAQMVDNGHLSPQRVRRVAAEPVELAPATGDSPRHPHVVDAVWRELLEEPALGPDRQARAHRLRTGGLEIHTSIDPQLQRQVDEAVARRLPIQGPSAAIAALEPATGRVRALHGGTGERGFGLATQARRQPGSTLKPFVAAAALEAGHDPSEPLAGRATATFDTEDGTWRVRNYRGAAHGRPDLARALRQSINTAFADLVTDYGVQRVVDVLDRVGVDLDAALGPPATRGPSIALGGLTHGVSPLELASAYTPFVTGGTRVEPHLVTRVVAGDGTTVLSVEEEARRALAAPIADRVGRLLRGVVRHGTGTPAQVEGAQVRGKTGTSQNGADAWFVGGDASLMAAVWVGEPQGRVAQPHTSGATVAAPLWREAVGEALRR